MNKIIRSMSDLETVLSSEDVPISATPTYFAETNNPDQVSIIAGASDTFDFDLEKEPDNRWIAQVSERFNDRSKLRYRTGVELLELKQRFEEAGFKNFYFLPAEVQGTISWIFINNAMSAGFNSEGKPLLYFGKMKNLCRLPEPALVEYYLRSHPKNPVEGFVFGHATIHTMEGKGDQLPMSLPLIKDGKQSRDEFYHIVINCSGRRTHPLALEEFAQASGNLVIEIPLSDDPVTGAYHGNVAIMYYQDKNSNRGVVYVPDMLREDKRDFVYEMFKTFFGQDQIHRITSSMPELYKESIELLSMNGISVGKGRMISSKNNIQTNEFLREVIGLDILEVDMQAISLGGGGLQCCYTALNRNPLILK